MDEEREMVPLDAHMRGTLDAVHTPTERDAGHRRFGAGRQQQQRQQYDHDTRRSGDNSYRHLTTTTDFGRVAESISVRTHHHRARRDDDVDEFNFGDDNEVRRQREHARMQQRNGAHRLGNDSSHHYSSSSSSYSNNNNTISNSSNGVGGSGQEKYILKLRASGAPITPGASFANSEEQRLNKRVPPPSKPDSFLTSIMNASKSSKASASNRPTGALRIPVAAPQASVLSASPTRQRLRTTSVLELGSAPSPSRSSQQNPSQSPTTRAKANAATPSLGWKSTRSRNPASSIVMTQQKPRINLTPNKRPFPEEHPTRTSPRTKRLLLGRDSSLGSSSSMTRKNREIEEFADETSNNTRNNNNGIGGEGTNTTSSILRRTTRLRAKKEVKTEGTADQPIDLDSDSDADSPDNKATKSADPPPRAKAKAKRRAAPTRKIEPHWKEVDMKVIKDDHTLEITDMTVWIGRLPCHADVYVRDDCVWICSIRSSVVHWNLMPQLQLHLKDFHGVHDEKAPISGDDLNAAERLMADRSFVALKAECASTADQDVLKPFYEPLGSDDSKEYIVIEAPDYDRHGMCFTSLHTELQERLKGLVNAIEDIDAGRAYLKALLREPYKPGGSATDDDQKRSASDYRSDEAEEEDESDCFDVQMTYPLPPCTSDIVTITRHDVSRLRPEQYLNDNIIDYYFKRLMLEEYAKTEYIQKNVLFLSSHFYSRLRMGKGSSVTERLKAGYKNVATWVTRTDFFSRSIIFIPINKDMHWSLALILNPKSAAIESPTKDQPPTCITLLDPLDGYHSKVPIVRHLKSFLQLEWENACAATAKDKDADSAAGGSSPASPPSSYNVDKVVTINVKLPHQQNSFDCGVYILKYADVILENYLFHEAAFGDLSSGRISKDVIDNKLDMLITAKAFAPENITQKRTEIQEFIATDTHKYHDMMHVIVAEQKENKESAAANASEAAAEAEADAGGEHEGEQEGERTAEATPTGAESN